MVHFVIEENGEVRPLCGEWGDDPSWTKIRSAVSCLRCLALIEADQDAPHAGPPSARHLAVLTDPPARA